MVTVSRDRLSYCVEIHACVYCNLFILRQDLRNYQYSVPVVESLRIHMEVGNSYIDIPKSKFNEVLLHTLPRFALFRIFHSC